MRTELASKTREEKRKEGSTDIPSQLRRKNAGQLRRSPSPHGSGSHKGIRRKALRAKAPKQRRQGGSQSIRLLWGNNRHVSRMKEKEKSEIREGPLLWDQRRNELGWSFGGEKGTGRQGATGGKLTDLTHNLTSKRG